MNFRHAHAAMMALANPKQAALLQRFFKTGKGEYAEGDRFLGIMIPAVRQVARDMRQLGLEDLEHLLGSPYNEERVLALLLLARRYERGTKAEKAKIYRCYLRNRRRVNNWNLVDLSAPNIVGKHLLHRSRAPLYRLARSKSVWDRRIAVLATFWFIREGDYGDSLELARQLLGDPHDLMHKACGWMLREIGKRDQGVLERFLREHCRTMPRTMLRYAIERFPQARRKADLSA